MQERAAEKRNPVKGRSKEQRREMVYLMLGERFAENELSNLCIELAVHIGGDWSDTHVGAGGSPAESELVEVGQRRKTQGSVREQERARMGKGIPMLACLLTLAGEGRS